MVSMKEKFVRVRLDFLVASWTTDRLNLHIYTFFLKNAYLYLFVLVKYVFLHILIIQ